MDGIMMDQKVNPKLRQAFPLDPIHEGVTFHGIHASVCFHVDGGVALVGAVIVDHQVVTAQDVFAGENLPTDAISQRGITAFSQKGRDGPFHRFQSAVKQKDGKKRTCVAVKGNTNEVFCGGDCYDAKGGKRIVSAVLGGGKQCSGINFRSHAAIIKGKKGFYRHRCR
jgi:hypothetical protein